MTKINVPDFDDMQNAIDRIMELTDRKLALDIQLRIKEADIVLNALTDAKYFVNNKPPSMTFIDSTYKYTGFDGELVSMREELAHLVAMSEHARNNFYLMKSQIDVWRTHTANERASLI